MYCNVSIKPVIRIVLSLLILFIHSLLPAQNVSVRMNTGTAHVSIPVYTIKTGEISVPVSIEYQAIGVRPAEVESVVGTGWELNAGGCITRELRDLPDDIKADQASNSRMGWLYNINASKIGLFTIANDNNTSTCNEETTDLSFISSQLSDNSDLEPDIFDVQAPGLSCQLVFDQLNGVFRSIPYQDLQISYTLNATSNSIISFAIKNDKGVTYTFAVPEAVGHTTSSSNPPGVIYFNRYYSLWKNGIIFNQKWYLSKITDPNGNYISLAYNTYGVRNLTIPTAVITGVSGGGGVRTVLYSDAIAYTPLFVTSIIAYNKITNVAIDPLYLTYVTTTNPALKVLQYIGFQSSRLFTCAYGKVPGTTRDFLSSFGESGCTSGTMSYNSNMYYFNYYGVSFTASNPNGNLWDLPLDGSGQDYWGFPNPGVDPFTPRIYVYPDNPSYPNLERYRFTPISGYTGTTYTLNGEDKTVDPLNILTGSLNTIIYPTGGTTTFTYEPNDYYDVSAAIFSTNVTSKGGGLRIKQIVDYDGLNSSNNIVRNYSYIDPNTGYTSGKPVGLPAISFTLPYTGTATGLDYWSFSTIRLSNSSSNQNESVVYGTVTLQQTGAGKTVYQYTTPATYWDATAGSDWTPTMVYTGRANSGGTCPAEGSVKNSKYGYPFPPNINYDFERGLLTSVMQYPEVGNYFVKKTDYTYQRSSPSATPITAFKFDMNSTVLGYAKYGIFTSVSELASTQTEYLYDVGNTTNDVNKRFTSSQAMFYAGTNHKLPTLVQTTNTDGSIDRTYIKYAKDYSWLTTDNTPLRFLKDLNKNIPVEIYNTVTRGGVEKTFSAHLTKFGSFSTGIGAPSTMYLPNQNLKFISATGVTNFTPSYNNSGTFTYYSGYIPVVNYDGYNYVGNLISQDDNFKNYKAELISNTIPNSFASVKNANWSEVAYSNFDGSDTLYGFYYLGATINGTLSRTGANSLSIPSSGKILTTKSLNLNAKNYIFSTWINSTGAGTMTLSLSNAGGSLILTKTINYSSSGSGWNYYELKVPTTGVTTGGFILQVQTSSTINIDDVLFYPEAAEVNTYAYSPQNFTKSSETNTNGVSKYYGYDNFFRLQYVYDQDKNIVLKKTYASASTATTGVISATFSTTPASGINVGTVVNFSGLASNFACTPGTLYSYNFGDGTSTTPSLTGSTASHTFTTAGTYSVGFTLTNSLFGSKTFNQNVTVVMVPVYCQSGVWAYAGGHVYQQACPPYSNDASHSYFQVTSITGLPPGHTVTYQWWIAYSITGANCGSTSWTTISGATSAQYVKNFVATTFCPYTVRCVVTDVTNGQQVTTGIMAVQNNLQ